MTNPAGPWPTIGVNPATATARKGLQTYINIFFKVTKYVNNNKKHLYNEKNNITNNINQK